MSALSHPEHSRPIAVRHRAATHSGLATTVATFLTSFTAAALLLHVAVGVLGHAAVERTRQSALSLSDTAKRVRATTIALQRNCERGTNPSAIASWARLHGFESSFLAARQDVRFD
jgi:hypothetical protein